MTGAVNSARTAWAPLCGRYIWKTWKVGVTVNLSSCASISEWMQLIDCATAATATFSALRWKMSSVMPVSSASRMVDCCERLYSRRKLGALAVPGSPFVDDEFHRAMARLVIDGLPVIVDDAIHDAGAGEQIVELSSLNCNASPAANLRGLPEV